MGNPTWGRSKSLHPPSNVFCMVSKEEGVNVLLNFTVILQWDKINDLTIQSLQLVSIELVQL